MVGSAGPTIVWSRAPRNRPSITANSTSSFSRWLRPSAGSSSSEGTYSSPLVGNASISGSIPPLGVDVVVSAVDRGRGEGRPQVGHGSCNALELRRIELFEDPGEELGLEHLDVLEQMPAGGRDPDEDDAPVAGD